MLGLLELVELRSERRPRPELVDQSSQPLAVPLDAREAIGEGHALLVEVLEILTRHEREELIGAEMDLFADERGERRLI